MAKQKLSEGNVFERVALNLYYYRTIESNLKVKDLAAKADIGVRVVNGIENRRHSPTILTLLKIARALDINYEDFFKEPPTFNPTVGNTIKVSSIREVREDLENERG